MTGLADRVFIKKYVPSAIVRFEKINRAIKPVNLCLDLGCSIGILTTEVAKKCENVIGLEIRKDAVKIAKQIAPKNCLFIVGDGTALPFKESVFDQVVSSEVIEHIKDYMSYISEASRVTKKGSQFILTTPNRVINFPSIGPMPALSLSWFLGKITRNPLFIYPYGHYYGGFSPAKLKRALRYKGFRAENVDYCGFALVKLMDDLAYIAAVKKKTYDDVGWFKGPGKGMLEVYKKVLPVIKLMIKVDELFLKLRLEGYIILITVVKN